MRLSRWRASGAIIRNDRTGYVGRTDAAAAVSRHPADLFRLTAGLMAFGVLAVAARAGHPGTIELDVVRLIKHLPEGATLALLILMQAGAGAAVAMAAGASFLARRYRLGLALLSGGAVASLSTVLFKIAVGLRQPGVVLSELLRGQLAGGVGFPSGHVATAAALATVGGPYLSRPLSRLTWLGVGLVAMARIAVGAHLPLDALGGMALGWVAGSAVNLILKAPTGMLREEEVREGLAELGFSASSLTSLAARARSSSPSMVRTVDGRSIFVKVVSPEQRNADLLWKLWRYAVYREVEDEVPFASPKQQVEHEAYLTLLAAQAGARVPEVLVAGVAHGAGMLVLQGIEGRSLDDIAPSAISDEVLDEAWRQALRLRAARIAHRDLRSANLLLDEGGDLWMVDFGFSEAAASARRMDLDAAELLASLALIAGVERAVASASRIAGRQVLGATLPFLQPFGLVPATRQEMRTQPGLLAQLRRATAQAAGREPPQLEPLVRWRWRTVIGLAAGLFAIHVLLPQLAELPQIARVLGRARWEWLAAAAVASALRYPMAALSMVSALERPIGLRWSTVAQLASSWANRAAPAGLGGIALKERFLERSGVERPMAVGALATSQIAGFTVHLLGLVAMAAYLGRNLLSQLHPPHGWPVVGLIALAFVIAGALLWFPVVRNKTRALVRGQIHALAAAFSTPLRAVALFGGAAGVNLGYALTLAASLHAFDANLAVVKIIAVYLAGSAIASASPTPGGLGVIEAALVAGLTALGAAAAPAVAGVLTFRLLTYWLTIIPGFVAFRLLRRRKLL